MNGEDEIVFEEEEMRFGEDFGGFIALFRARRRTNGY